MSAMICRAVGRADWACESATTLARMRQRRMAVLMVGEPCYPLHNRNLLAFAALILVARAACTLPSFPPYLGRPNHDGQTHRTSPLCRMPPFSATTNPALQRTTAAVHAGQAFRVRQES